MDTGRHMRLQWKPNRKQPPPAATAEERAQRRRLAALRYKYKGRRFEMPQQVEPGAFQWPTLPPRWQSPPMSPPLMSSLADPSHAACIPVVAGYDLNSNCSGGGGGSDISTAQPEQPQQPPSEPAPTSQRAGECMPSIRHFEASPASGLWRDAVAMLDTSAGNMYERRQRWLQLNMETTRGPHVAELGASQATCSLNGVALVHSPHLGTEPLAQRPVLGFVFAVCPDGPAPSNEYPAFAAAVRTAQQVMSETDWLALRRALLRCGSYVHEDLGTDEVRSGFRLATGLPELVTKG